MTENIWMTDLTKKAFQIAYEAHKNQMDKMGMPYILHPIIVAEGMETEYGIAAALLHDVVEDTEVTLESLRKQGIPEAVLEVVSVLTRDRDMVYEEYVRQVSRHPLARLVKRQDLLHNLSPTRYEAGEVGEQHRKRYRKALQIIEEAIEKDI